MIEVIFQVRKDKFCDHEAVLKELDLVEEEDQFTHLITLDDATNSEDILSKYLWFVTLTFHYKKYSHEIMSQNHTLIEFCL
jgi:pre-mRNA-splicing factor CWC22